jgi:hypothetical protein
VYYYDDVSTEAYTMFFKKGGKAVSFGKACESDDLLETEWDFKFNKRLLQEDGTEVPFITEQGTSGIWNYRKWSNGIAECWGRTTEMKVWFGGDWYGKCLYAMLVVDLPQVNGNNLFDIDAQPPCVNITTVSGYGIHSNSVTGIEDNKLTWYSAHHSDVAENIIVTYSIEVKGRWE